MASYSEGRRKLSEFKCRCFMEGCLVKLKWRGSALSDKTKSTFIVMREMYAVLYLEHTSMMKNANGSDASDSCNIAREKSKLKLCRRRGRNEITYDREQFLREKLLVTFASVVILWKQ